MASGRERWDWRGHRLAVVLALAILAALAVWVAAEPGWRAALAAALARLSLAAVLVVLPVQALAIFVCAVAQWLLRPGPGLGACFAARLTRDAGNNVLLVLPGLGEAVGVRMLVLAGARPRAALVTRALDIAAETLGQLPYFVIAGVVLARVWRRVGLATPALSGGWPLALGVALSIAAGLAGQRLARRLIGRLRLVRRLRAEARLLWREARARHAGMPAAIALHMGAWALSGVQIWLAARAMHLPLGLAGGVAVESAASAVRVVLFFVPGGLVSQEAGAVGAGLALGLPPAASLALALVLRARDVAFGLAVGWWPLSEWRAAARARGA